MIPEAASAARARILHNSVLSVFACSTFAFFFFFSSFIIQRGTCSSRWLRTIEVGNRTACISRQPFFVFPDRHYISSASARIDSRLLMNSTFWCLQFCWCAGCIVYANVVSDLVHVFLSSRGCFVDALTCQQFLRQITYHSVLDFFDYLIRTFISARNVAGHTVDCLGKLSAFLRLV